MPLTIDEITALLNKENQRASVNNPPQVGPLRWQDTTVRCAKRRCVCPTNYRVQGVPYCSIHALEELNMMLVAQGFKGVNSRVMLHPTMIPDGRVVTSSVRAYLEVGWSLGKFECIHGINLTKDCDYCVSSGN